ncbi:alpha/beta fold hydrolase [Actinoplanes couchii]|uniref:AB hydrolase-1 domain-containing protein n=1 Tax=Actinoplanes couchii TaxID=403638 RepID=A0ABQ3XPU2_9ACTN|nr:alpha/beta fold hydrolase [Actinoplanes couchii]MDR6319184.1 hypothetical protein [Actinoplanes couchii]GID60524.1 hypothetical protein Aco03nite_089280 [Actinoplanes couchii]
MNRVFVLMHSPLVGPSTWAGVAALLPHAVVPSLRDAEPSWQAVAATVAAAIDRVPAGVRVVLVAHSNAGRFVPAVLGAAARSVDVCLFADAALPGPARLDLLRAKVGPDGLLPRWTDWWDEADVAPMFPDEETRRLVESEQPRLPLAFFEQQVPVPDGWDSMPCGYLLFSERSYGALAEQAGGRGWRVEHLPGRHLHQVVDPGAVAAALQRMSDL